MKPRVLLLIAFGVILFHIVGHTMGHFTWKETNDSALTGIIAQMYAHEFEFMGKSQTVGGHHDGFSWLFEITLVTFSALTWTIARRIESAVDLREVLLIMSIALVACGIVELIYFFPLAGGSSLLAGMLQVWAYRRSAT
jgi:hypothetical protein